MPNPRPKIAITIPNFNGLTHLHYCVPSLEKAAAGKFPIALIDDRSSDDSLIWMQREHPGVVLLRNERSQGFAGSVNTGLNWAFSTQNADFAIVANNDIQLNSEVLKRLKEVLEREPLKNCGLIGFKEFNPPHTPQELSKEMPAVDLGELRELEAIPGCFFVMSRECFERIGFLDESYYMYGEDNDYFYNVRRAGLKILQTELPIWHRGEGSSSGSLKTSWLAYRNAIRFSIKNLSLTQIAMTTLSLLNQGINPFLKKKRSENPSYRRLSRHSAPVNVSLLVSALVWNFLHLDETIKLRNAMKRMR